MPCSIFPLSLVLLLFFLGSVLDLVAISYIRTFLMCYLVIIHLQMMYVGRRI